MQDYFEKTERPIIAGQNITGPVIDIDRNAMYIDLSPYGTGVIFGKEFLSIKDIIKNINVGDPIESTIVDTEGYKGYIELSLKEARKATIWAEAENHRQDGTILSLPIKEANKGGLMITWQGITGFLPASQLGPDNYPKVSGGDKNRILLELEKLVNRKLDVQIITVDPKEEKLIFTEAKTDATAAAKASKTARGGSMIGNNSAHDAGQTAKSDLLSNYSVGDELDGEITGAVDFGLFVKVAEGLEGLVHISEISWSLVENPESLYKVGDNVRVKVIDVNPEKISLSIKALQPNPWQAARDKYKTGQEVNAVVIRHNDHGALASVEEGVAGLVHISEFADAADLRTKLSLGNSYTFKINVFDADKQKMTLSLADQG